MTEHFPTEKSLKGTVDLTEHDYVFLCLDSDPCTQLWQLSTVVS